MDPEFKKLHHEKAHIMICNVTFIFFKKAHMWMCFLMTFLLFTPIHASKKSHFTVAHDASDVYDEHGRLGALKILDHYVQNYTPLDSDAPNPNTHTHKWDDPKIEFSYTQLFYDLLSPTPFRGFTQGIDHKGLSLSPYVTQFSNDDHHKLILRLLVRFAQNNGHVSMDFYRGLKKSEQHSLTYARADENAINSTQFYNDIQSLIQILWAARYTEQIQALYLSPQAYEFMGTHHGEIFKNLIFKDEFVPIYQKYSQSVCTHIKACSFIEIEAILDSYKDMRNTLVCFDIDKTLAYEETFYDHGVYYYSKLELFYPSQLQVLCASLSKKNAAFIVLTARAYAPQHYKYISDLLLNNNIYFGNLNRRTQYVNRFSEIFSKIWS